MIGGIMRLRADLLLFMVAVIWGTAFVAQGVAGHYHVAYLFNGASFLLASFILLPFVPRGARPSRAQLGWMLAAGVVLFAATALQQVGLLYTRIANASFLTSLYAVFTPFLLLLGFRERPHPLDLLAVGLAVGGAFLLSTAGSFTLHPGDLLELIGSLFWALHFVLLGKFAAQFESISFAAGHFFVSGLLNLLMGLRFEDPRWLLPLPVLGAVLYRATLSIGIGYTLQVWGQKHTPPTDAALILGLEAVFAALAGWLALGQALAPLQILGCAIIFIAVLISQAKSWSRIAHDHLVEGR
jgi:drug/metabolite transporter (DMT)-like permease